MKLLSALIIFLFPDFLIVQTKDTNKPQKRTFANVNKRILKYIPIAACIALVLSISFLNNRASDIISLKNSTGRVSVKYVKNPTAPSPELGQALLIPLTEQEILDRSNVIVYGKVTNFEHIEIGFGVNNDYRTLISVEIFENYKGNTRKGEVIRILAPCVLDGSRWIEDTGVISKLAKGDEAFFLLHQYDENDSWEMEEGTLILRDISNFGMGDGERFVLINKNDNFVFATWAFESLSQNSSHEDIERFILSRVK